VGDHALSDAAAGQACGFGTAKDAKDIVLGAGEAVRLEELLAFEAEAVRGLLEGDEDSGFDGENRMWSGATTHALTIVVMTTSVKRKEMRAVRETSTGEEGNEVDHYVWAGAGTACRAPTRDSDG
jgi:hypothetical protein